MTDELGTNRSLSGRQLPVAKWTPVDACFQAAVALPHRPATGTRVELVRIFVRFDSHNSMIILRHAGGSVGLFFSVGPAHCRAVGA